MVNQQRLRASWVGGVLGAIVGICMVSAARPVAAAQQVTAETLLDRIQIEDLLTRYYYDLSQGGDRHVLSDYFTEDALLDVDGTIARGHGEIAKLYERPDDGESIEQTRQRRRGHMLLTNPIIEINGDRAIAHVIWTGVMNEGVGQPPSLYEQGREDTELVRQNGRWLIKQRYISSDSGTPDRFDQTYEPRDNPLNVSP
ncbi:MAG: nuclear transport factor 2 family protein [Gammaproteobacteria bacterium]|nr:nuclear transport factor 2 family protein [Gammaproteobacteria bacterium]